MEQTAQPQSPISNPLPKVIKKWPYILGSVLVVLAGVGVGWLISSKGKIGSGGGQITGSKTGAKEAGVVNEKLYPETAEGTLEEGGLKGEGTFHLIRPGGNSQTVYLTSTVVDMSVFVGKKVQVWGKSASARYAPWLMEIGRIKVIE